MLGSAEAPCAEADSPRVNGAANTCRGYSGGLVTVTVGSDVADPGDAGAYIEPTETYRWRLLAINEANRNCITGSGCPPPHLSPLAHTGGGVGWVGV